jgi:hypothetical protein
MAETKKDVSQEIIYEISNFLNDPVNYTQKIEIDEDMLKKILDGDMLKEIFTKKLILDQN